MERLIAFLDYQLWSGSHFHAKRPCLSFFASVLSFDNEVETVHRGRKQVRADAWKYTLPSVRTTARFVISATYVN